VIRIFLLVLSLSLSLISSAGAETFSKTVIVRPGDNGTLSITNRAAVKDTVTIAFKAKDGYELVSADVDDPDKLGWKPAGDFSFSLTVSDELKRNVNLTARFYGQLRKKPAEAGAGKGPKKKDEEDKELYDWNLQGVFKVLGSHEGTGVDEGRSPPGNLESKKPGGDPVPTEEARYDPETKQFIGSFRVPDEKERTFTGLYKSYPAVADPATRVPEQLGEPELRPCPEGDDTKVHFVYFGAEDAGGIGGMAKPDIIAINSFTANPTAAEAQVDADAKTAARKELQTAKDKAQAEKIAADKVVEAAEATLQAALVKVPSVKAAQKRVDSILEKLKTATGQQKENLEKNLEDAKKKLNKALQDAAEKKDVIAAQAALDDAKATATTADQTLALATKTLQNAIEAEKQAVELAEQQADLEEGWTQVYNGTKIHEEGHRRICYFYADKLTEMLKKLRTWGYAPTVERAKSLGALKFEKERNERVLAILEADRAMQRLYDSKDGTDHGINQEKWNWDILK
jgi:hypothetical protein